MSNVNWPTAVQSLRNMVEASASVSVRNYLRARAQSGLVVVSHFNRQVLRGELSLEDAKAKAAEFLLEQPIGSSGYFYVLDSLGVLRVHPKSVLIGVDVTENWWVKEQVRRKHGYIEYSWKNPGEEAPRDKAFFMEYFEPWDWIITASSYRDEFQEFVNPEDFRDAVLSLKHGEGGYSYVIDRKGTLIIHPYQEGDNVLEVKDSDGRMLFKELLALGEGLVTYRFKNKMESEPMTKWARISPIQGLPWYVVSTYYEKDIEKRVQHTGVMALAALLAVLVLVFFGTWWISRYFSHRFNQLIGVFQAGIEGDLGARSGIEGRDEFGAISRYVNSFLAGLEQSHEVARRELAERKRAQEELQQHKDRLEDLVAERTRELERTNQALAEDNQRRSEAEQAVRSVLDNTHAALIIHDQDGNIVDVNRRMLELYGLDYEQAKRCSIVSDLSMPQNPVRMLSQVWTEVHEGESRAFQWMARRPITAEAFPVEVILKPVRYFDRDLVLASITDISEKRAMYDRLERSEKKFRLLYEGNRDAVMLMGQNVFTDCNPATLKMFGCGSKEDFLGKGPDAFSPEFQPSGEPSADFAKKMIGIALSQGSHSFEWLHCRLDGSAFPASVKLSVVEFDEENVIQAVVRDITERKLVEQKLKASRDFMDVVINHLPDPLFIKDKEHRFVRVNEAMCRFTGRTKENLIGKTDYDLFPKEEADVFLAKDQEVLAGDLNHFNEECFTDASGMTHIIHTNKTRIADERGDLLILGTIRDMTDLKTAQNELLLIRAAIDHSSDAVSIRGADGEPVYHNQRYLDLFKLSGGVTSNEIPEMFQDRSMLDAISARLAQGESWRGEVMMKAMDGTVFPVWLRLDAVKGEDGSVVAYIGLHTDISEKRKSGKESGGIESQVGGNRSFCRQSGTGHRCFAQCRQHSEQCKYHNGSDVQPGQALHRPFHSQGHQAYGRTPGRPSRFLDRRPQGAAIARVFPDLARCQPGGIESLGRSLGYARQTRGPHQGHRHHATGLRQDFRNHRTGGFGRNNPRRDPNAGIGLLSTRGQIGYGF